MLIKMKNLAGKKEADEVIQKELLLASIEMEKGEPNNRREVPYTITGKIGNWNLRRAWYYWIASVQQREDGLPLEVAAELHEREYPVVGENQPENYGKVIRVAGNCGCPHPREWAFPTRKVLERESKRIEQDLMRTTNGELAKLCNSGVVQGERFVYSYHIDTQLGLNEFARVVKDFLGNKGE